MGQVELDALEALVPGEVANAVMRAAEPYRDPGLAARLFEAKSEARRVASAVWREQTGDLQEDLNRLADAAEETIAPYRERLEELRAEFDEAMDPHRELLEQLEAEFADRADQFDPELPDRPEPADPPAVDERDVLFDSRRDWLAQLDRYGVQPEPIERPGTCERCGKEIVVRRASRRFCSDECRKRNHRERKRNGRPARDARAEAEAAIVALLRESDGPMRQGDIARALGRDKTDGTVRRVLKALVEDGTVALADGGYRAATGDNDNGRNGHRRRSR
jgi:hypothetical protein